MTFILEKISEEEIKKYKNQLRKADAIFNYYALFGITLNIKDADKSGLETPFNVFQGAVQSAVPPKDPLIIDVNNNGLKLSSWQSSGVKFDMDGNGTTESTGWTTPSSSNYSYVKGSGAIIIDQANANLIDRIVFGL